MEEKVLIQEGRLVYKLVTDRNENPYIMIGVVVEVHTYTSSNIRDFTPFTEYDIRWFAGAPDDLCEHWGFDEANRWYGDGDRRNDFELDPDIIAKRWTDWAVMTMAERLSALKSAQADGRIITYHKQEEERY